MRSLCATIIMVPVLAAAAVADQKPNTLSKQEIADGWILLFDGESKFGWFAEQSEHESDWTVRDGALTCNREAGFNHLRHRGVFADFVLKLEFRVNKGGNGGVFFRGGNKGQPFVGEQIIGYEAQIDDNDPRGLLYQTGSLYDVLPAQKLIKGEGRWRAYEITADGDHLVTRIDGQTIVDDRDKRFTHGHIGIQHHHTGNVIEFRSIKLKPLGMRSLFNGKDLTGWRVVEPPAKQGERLLKQRWMVRDGLLHVDVPPMEGIQRGGRGNLETTSMFRDFALQIDVRTNGTHFNSGVFFRCLPKLVGQGYESQIRNQWEGDDRTKPVDFGTGGIYRRVPARKVVSDDREFFTKTIVATGRYVGVWVNGHQVTDFSDTRPESDNARDGYCPNAGTISLQSHDPTTDLDFRNIRVAELPNGS